MGSSLQEHIGLEVRRRRQKRRLTLRELAWSAGVSRETLIAVEHGKTNFTLATLEGIARALKCSTRNLLPHGLEGMG